MAVITITVPQRVLDSVTVLYGWTPDSGLTKTKFTRRWLIQSLVHVVRMHEGAQAANAAVANIETELGMN